MENRENPGASKTFEVQDTISFQYGIETSKIGVDSRKRENKTEAEHSGGKRRKLKSSREYALDEFKIPPGEHYKSTTKGKTENKVPAQQIAFSISLILEEIFKKLDFASLKICRQVCHGWNFSASKQLEKLSRIRIYTEISHYDKQIYSYGFIKEFGNLRFQFNKVEPFRSLQLILNDHQEFSHTSSAKFPCSNFGFSKANLSIHSTKVFFEAHGHILKTLELDLFYSNSDQENLNNDLQFIFQNCPNLRKLTLSSNITKEWAEKINEKIQHENIDAKSTSLSKPYPNPSSLNKIKFATVCPAKIIEALIESNTNRKCALEGISVANENLDIFLKPKSSIHFLKSLHFDPQPNLLDMFEKLSFEKELKLQKISFDLTYLYSFSFGPPENSNLNPLDPHLDLELEANWMRLENRREVQILWRRVAGILSRLLKGSADTLRSITWEANSLTFWNLVELPGVFENVKKLKLKISTESKFSPRGHPTSQVRKQFFPAEFQIAKSFCSLKHVTLINRRSIFSFNFEKMFGGEKIQIVESVRSLKLRDNSIYSWSDRRKFKQMFPNVWDKDLDASLLKEHGNSLF